MSTGAVSTEPATASVRDAAHGPPATAFPDGRAIAELVRLPAVLSVPGDVLLGAAAAGRAGDLPRAAGLTAASSCMYLAGMALNDYADREVDARERPGRPIPSGRVTPGFALGLAAGLTAAGMAVSVAVDGPRALRIAAPLAASVWAYDLALKRNAAGVPGMAACRALDVILGAGAGSARPALAAATVVGAHTAVVTSVSRSEVEGARPGLARAAAATTAAIACAGAAIAARRSRSFTGSAVAAGLLGAYAAAVGGAQAAIAADPSPERTQRAVGAGVLGVMPLEAGMLAGAGAIGPAAAIAGLWPMARSLARRRSVT